MTQSASRRALYVGVTSKLTNRVYQHKTHARGGFTSKYNAERLVWFEQFSDIRSAINREKQIKNWRREKKEWLVKAQNPEWRDLSKEWFTRHQFQPETSQVTQQKRKIPRLATSTPASQKTGLLGTPVARSE
jgi:putative endonuclease